MNSNRPVMPFRVFSEPATRHTNWRRLSLIMFKNFPKEWFSNVPKDLLAGLVVALALIPEAIAFSIIAGVDPKVGLYA